MFRLLLLLIFITACSSTPKHKELSYQGEPLAQIAPHGLVVGHVVMPLDKFPFDQKTTNVYLENIKTKKIYEYGPTQGAFFMKLPPGDYVVKDFQNSLGCNNSTGIFISNFFHELPGSVSHLRRAFEKQASAPLTFKIIPGKMSDIGNLLMTCWEWNQRAKFKNDFANFIEDGRFQIFMPTTSEAQECGCKIVRKRDGVSVRAMKKALEKN